jgi:hypothetical protein
MKHRILRHVLFTLALVVTIVTAVLISPGRVEADVARDWPSAPPASTNNLRIADAFVRNDVSIPKGYNFQNNSEISTVYPQAMIVTPANGKWQIGGLWSKQRIDLNNAFTYDTVHYFGSSMTGDNSAADGMTFTLQNDPQGYHAYGTPGGGLGAYPWGYDPDGGGSKYGELSNYIQNALSIEMDSYFNNSGVVDDRYDVNEVNGGNGHLAVVRPGATPLTTKVSADVGHLQFVSLGVPLANSQWKPFTVSWQPKVNYESGQRVLGGVLTYTLTNTVAGSSTPTKTSSSFTINNVQDYFHSDHVLFGYTGATGPHKTFQAVAVNKLPQSAKPVTVQFQDDAGNELQTAITMNGEVGNTWDAATRRNNWLKYNNDWYEYTGYTADTADGKDAGTFSATTPYTVTYKYTKREAPETYVLQKQVKNVTSGTDYAQETDASAGDTVEYQLDYANLSGISVGKITDQLDPGLGYKANSLQIADDDTDWQYQSLSDAEYTSNNTVSFPYALDSGQQFSLRLQATVQETDKAVLPNVATVAGNSKAGTSNTVNVNLPSHKPFIIHKVDQQNNSVKLANAVFSVQNVTTPNAQSQNLTTGVDGIAQLNPNAKDEQIFELQEKAAPTGYVGSKQTYEVKWNADQGIIAVRNQNTNQAWGPKSDDGLATVTDGELTFANNKNGQVTVRDFDRVSGKVVRTQTFTGPIGSKLSTVASGGNLPGTYSDRSLWGYSYDLNLPPAGTLESYDSSNPPDPVFSADKTTLTYVFDQQMFELNPDPQIEFGNFSQDQSDRNYNLGEMRSTTKQKLPFGVAVTDRIGVSSWQLSVSQNGQFSDGHDALNNATLWFKNLHVTNTDVDTNTTSTAYQYTATPHFDLNPDGSAQTVLTVNRTLSTGGAAATGMSTQNWQLDFGNQITGGASVGVHVPEETVRAQARYTTSLTWTAAALP